MRCRRVWLRGGDPSLYQLGTKEGRELRHLGGLQHDARYRRPHSSHSDVLSCKSYRLDRLQMDCKAVDNTGGLP
jgi:hypothetical protein